MTTPTRTSTVSPHRPGLGSWLTLIRCETKMVVRDTAGLIVPIGLPLLILVMNAMGAADEEIVGGRTALDIFIMPIVFTIVVATIGIINMPSFLATYRKTGVLRRLGVTPASPAMVLIAQVVVSLLQAMLGIALALGVAVVFFDANLPIHLGSALGVVALTIAAMYALGMLVAALSPTPNAAVAIGLVFFFVLGALGGMFGGQDSMPETLARVGEWLPFGAAVDGLSSAWAGETVDPSSLALLGGTGLVATALSAMLFRWE